MEIDGAQIQRLEYDAKEEIRNAGDAVGDPVAVTVEAKVRILGRGLHPVPVVGRFERSLLGLTENLTRSPASVDDGPVDMDAIIDRCRRNVRDRVATSPPDVDALLDHIGNLEAEAYGDPDQRGLEALFEEVVEAARDVMGARDDGDTEGDMDLALRRLGSVLERVDQANALGGS